MKLEQIKEAMRRYIISTDDEAQDALNFVRDLIDAEINYLEVTAPYAVVSIGELKKASMTIMSLLEPDEEEENK